MFQIYDSLRRWRRRTAQTHMKTDELDLFGPANPSNASSRTVRPQPDNPCVAQFPSVVDPAGISLNPNKPMNDLNLTIVAGRLVRNPELRSAQSGIAVGTFCIAVNHRYQDKAKE